MKLCFTTFACPEWTLRQIITAAEELHYDGIELRCDAGHDHGVEAWTTPGERAAFRKRVEKADLEIACLATSLQFITQGIRREAMERLKLASDIGAKGMRVLCGPMPETMRDKGEAIERVGMQLRELADAAEYSNTPLWLETHDTFARAVDAAAAVRTANHPFIGLCYNNLHTMRKGEPLETTIAALGDLLRHVHFHDGLNDPNRVIVRRFGQGDMPIDETFNALIRMGYDGYLCGEWFHNQLGDDPHDALEAYRDDMITLTQHHGVRLSMK